MKNFYAICWVTLGSACIFLPEINIDNNAIAAVVCFSVAVQYVLKG